MPDGPFQRLRRFLSELRRRNVYQVAVTYAVVGFVLIQVADLTFIRLGLPSWTVTFVIVLVAMGFPLALVLAWAFERTPEGVQWTPEATPDAESAESEAGLRTGYRVLVGLGLLAAAGAGGWYLTGGVGESPGISEGTVAVLPFQVSGPDTETWREGMVTMLSTGLDGAARLRAIPDQTVLAAWEETTQSGRGGAEGPSLSTAQRIEAEFAVIGQAAHVGNELLLSADVYRTRARDRLGQAEVRGSPDSVAALADSLTRRVLGVLLEKGGGELPSVDIGRVTTRSRPALRAYLEGERHFRTGNFEAAVAAYRRAIRADSTFALAYARLSNAAGWGGITGERAPLRRAHDLADQLPTREQRLVQALYDWIQRGDRLAAADTLRRLTRTYPDDPTVWYNLGEVLWHGQVPGGWPEAEDAFERAVELDPQVAAYHHHLVDLAFSLHRDSALAASRIAAHPGREDRKRLFRTSLDLVFGGPESRRRALDRVETVPVPNDWALWMNLRHPLDGESEDRVLRALWNRDSLRRRADPGTFLHVPFGLVLNDLEHGRITRAMADAEMVDLPPTLRACYLAGTMAIGVPVPDSLAERYLEPSSLPSDASLRRLKCAGMYLIEQGRKGDLEDLRARVRDASAGTLWPTIEMDQSAESALDLLRGYRAWRAGDLEAASEALADSSPWDWWSGTGAIWRGDFYRDLGQLEAAEGWYLAAWWHPVAHERLGRLYEEMGRPEEAAAAYHRFVAAWENADAPLRDRIEGARERLERVTRN